MKDGNKNKPIIFFGSSRGLIASFLEGSSGNYALYLALAVAPIFGMVGVALDYTRVSDVRSDLQLAVDSAVLAGARESAGISDKAKNYFDSNFDASQVDSVSRSFDSPSSDTLHGTATATIETTFSKVIGFDQFSVVVESKAAIAGGTTNDVCIMALSTSASQAFLVNSGADVKASTCKVHVKSVANPAAVFNAGTAINTAGICIAGMNIIDNGGTHPNLTKGCTTATDPFVSKIPAPASSTCNFNNLNYSGTVTLNPGVYCGWFNFNSGTNVTLNPGTYVIKSGGWNVNGGAWKGYGVTFYYADTSKIQFNSAVQATLSAPTSGPYLGILMAEAPSLSNTQFIFDDNLGFDMYGVIYLPSRDIVFNSGTTVRSHKMTAIGRTFILNSVKWNITPYDGSTVAGSASKSARLVL